MNGSWDDERRNYRGGQNRPIWVVDLKSLDLESPPGWKDSKQMDPAWVGDDFIRWYRFDSQKLLLSLDGKFDDPLVWERLPRGPGPAARQQGSKPGPPPSPLAGPSEPWLRDEGVGPC